MEEKDFKERNNKEKEDNKNEVIDKKAVGIIIAFILGMLIIPPVLPYLIAFLTVLF